MTFPSGGPAPTPAARPAATQELDKLLHMAAAGLSVLVLVAGFFSFAPAASAYAVGLGWIPALYLIAGGLSAQVLLPGTPAKPGFLPGLVAVAVTLPLLFTVFTAGATAFGAYLVLVLGVLTAVAAVGGYLVEAGIISAPAPKPQQPQQPGQWSPQTGGFPQPQPGQPGGPFAQPGYGQATQVVPQPQQQPGGPVRRPAAATAAAGPRAAARPSSCPTRASSASPRRRRPPPAASSRSSPAPRPAASPPRRRADSSCL
ncbi:DUF5336 domain-containing protein, partial [Kutzneria sp. 744]|uniref:DUF5336 domain-containing protein n=1 Tax=Kutzneria sp. (strain 744) TaxID=345341 RepID=UPI0003EEDD82